MKRTYESPELKIVSFDPADVIMTSTESSIPEIIVSPSEGSGTFDDF